MSWANKRLEEVADFSLGKMLDQKKNKGEPLPSLANINVRWGKFDLDNLRQMRFEPNEMECFGLKYGDIVMCEGGEPGRCAIWKDHQPRIMIQKALHRIRPHDCLNNRFLFYSFLHKGKTGGFAPLFTGSTIKHLQRQQLAKVEIDIPPLPIQRRIASILSAYDDLIENNRRRIQLLEQAVRLLYKEWFVHLRFPGHEHVKIKDGVPEGWENRCVGNLAGVQSGFAFKSKDWQQEGNPVIKIKNILGDGTINNINCDYVSDSVAEKAASFAIPIGSLLIAMTGATVGKVGIMSDSSRKFYLNQRVGLFKSKNNDPVERYLFPFFQDSVAQTQVLNLAGGAAQPNIKWRSDRIN